jgi:hypothetical protein
MLSHILWLLHKLLNTKSLISCVLTMTVLLSTQAAVARYQPPRQQKPPSGYTDSSGVRGGCKVIDGQKLTLLAPVTHVGQTTLPHPSFAWFVPNIQAVPMEFALYEFDDKRQPKLLHKLSLKSSLGIMKLSLPQHLPGLRVGKRYLWQVQTLCNRNRPSLNVIARAEIEVVKMPQSLKTALSKKQNRSRAADLYAEAGMWYDALSIALPPTTNRELGNLAASLLEDLAKLEKPPQSRDLTKIIISYR